MADPFIGEIRMFAGNFAPQGWALCNGQLLSISQNTALFSLLGTTYGGDGRTTFALPDLRGRSPLHPGQGPGLSPYDLGEQGGEENVTLQSGQMAAHNHAANASSNAGDQAGPGGYIWAMPGAGRGLTMYTATANTSMHPSALGTSGGNEPHNNLSPRLGLSFIIALQGVYPPRS